MDHRGATRFVGVFSADTLPDVASLQLGNNFIVNCSDHTGGTHWVAMGCPTRPGKPAVYFDSYGFPPDGENIILHTKSHFTDYLNKMAQRFKSAGFIYNRANLQQSTSAYCGHYAIYFCLNGLPLEADGSVRVPWRNIYSVYGSSFQSDKAIAHLVKLSVH
jgi:hypothetical protein